MFNYASILNNLKNKIFELRHDVDISIDSAYRMSVLETKLGIKSIYYLRFDSDYYNVFSQKNKKIIDFLQKNHEIGCHIDVSSIDNENDLINYLKFYRNFLDFNKFTFHINTDKTKSFGEVPFFENKSLLKNFYISDSMCNFDSEKFEQIKNKNNFTLLIHPEWWDNENFEFCGDNSITQLKKILNSDNIIKQSLKEILKIENE